MYLICIQNTLEVFILTDIGTLLSKWQLEMIARVCGILKLFKRGIAPVPLEPQNAKYIDIPFGDDSKKGCADLVRSFVQVRTLCPSPIDSHPFRKDICYAVVIDATHGYVLVSRKYVPHYLCDIFIVFAESIEVPGKVVFYTPISTML